jgi:hypothetical protein
MLPLASAETKARSMSCGLRGSNRSASREKVAAAVVSWSAPATIAAR